MDTLNKLIGEKVKAKIEDVEFEGIVHQINIDD